MESVEVIEAMIADALHHDEVNDGMEMFIDSNTKKIVAPRNLVEACSRPDAKRWREAVLKEMNSIYGLGVMSTGYTQADLLRMGIDKPPVPVDLIFDVKYHPDGTLDKYKARFVQKGHSGNMKKGVHYDEVFAPAPKLVSTRLLKLYGLNWGGTHCLLILKLRSYMRKPKRENNIQLRCQRDNVSIETERNVSICYTRICMVHQ